MGTILVLGKKRAHVGALGGEKKKHRGRCVRKGGYLDWFGKGALA